MSISDSILEKLNHVEKMLAEQNDVPMSFKQAAAYLDMSESCLYKFTCKNQIRHYKPNGKKIYFNKPDLKEWVFKNRVKTAEEIDQEAVNRVMNK